MSALPRRPLEVEEVGDLTLVRFNDRTIVDAFLRRAIKEELLHLVDQAGRRRLLLNFAGVEYVSSAAIASFIALHKGLQTVGGRLVLCGLGESVLQLFIDSRLDKLFTIRATEQEGMQQLRGP